MSTTIIGFRLERELDKTIRDYQAKTNKTISEIVRECIEEKFKPSFEDIK